MIRIVEPVINHAVRDMCKMPYAGHPAGCPNFGSKRTCPPQAPLFEDIFDLAQPVYAIIYRFDMAIFKSKLRNQHPEWTEEQVRAAFYQTGDARNGLKQEIIRFLREHRVYRAVTSPEAMGVDVVATMQKAGIDLEWNSDQTVYKIALAAVRKIRQASR